MQIGTLEIKEAGKVEEVKLGVIKISGLPNCLYGQVIEVGDGLKGMVIEFNQVSVLGIVFGDENRIKVGDYVYSQDKSLDVPVGDNFIGRIVNSLAEPIDNRGDIVHSDFYPVFRCACGVMERQPINETLYTGVKILDLIVPIGLGQRELIVGDRQVGKTSIALDTIINQKDRDRKSVV